MGGLFSYITSFFTDQEPEHSKESRPDSYVINIPEANHHQNEREFFWIFFSTLGQVPGYQGIRQRWEKEAQKATNNRYNMSRVWNKNIGYFDSLEEMQKLVSNEKFRFNRRQLLKLANVVVSQREFQYSRAVKKHRADPGHRATLEQWQAVRDILRNLS